MGLVVRSLYLVTFMACLAFMPFPPSGQAEAAQVRLPTTAGSTGLLPLDFSLQSEQPETRSTFCLRGDNSVRSLWDLGSRSQSSMVVGRSPAWAEWETSRGLQASCGDWWIGYGEGVSSEYQGNRDAAQLWVDLLSGRRMRWDYYPNASGIEIAVSWLEVGHSVSFKTGSARGRVNLSLRQLYSDSFAAGSIRGEVHGEQFMGSAQTVASSSSVGSRGGTGWSVDAAVYCDLDERWRVGISAENMIGEMTWRDMNMEGRYVVSPRVFEDADGLLRDSGGIQGSSWLEDRTFRIAPRYRITVIRRGYPDMMAGLEYHEGSDPVAGIGVSWSRDRTWSPYVHYFPGESRVEAGAVGRGWHISVSGDDWVLASPKRLEASMGLAVISF